MAQQNDEYDVEDDEDDENNDNNIDILHDQSKNDNISENIKTFYISANMHEDY